MAAVAAPHLSATAPGAAAAAGLPRRLPGALGSPPALQGRGGAGRGGGRRSPGGVRGPGQSERRRLEPLSLSSR